jgi:hypothetical protein
MKLSFFNIPPATLKVTDTSEVQKNITETSAAKNYDSATIAVWWRPHGSQVLRINSGHISVLIFLPSFLFLDLWER